MKHLTQDFLVELFKLFFRRREMIEVCIIHLKYQYLPIQAYKDLWKAIQLYYKSQGSIPTIGIMSQKFNSGTKEDDVVLEVLEKIKAVSLPNEDEIKLSLEEYIKDSMVAENIDSIIDTWNKGNREKARSLYTKGAESLINFSLTKDTNRLERIFANFENRLARRRLEDENITDSSLKASFGIPELDTFSKGGIDEGDIALWLGQSGAGKTKLLRWIGVYNATVKGLVVLHIQLEGTKKECESGYDATWTSHNLSNLEKGRLDPELVTLLNKNLKDFLALGGEIYIEAYEKFNSATLVDVRSTLIEFEKVYGRIPHLVLIDYFELLEPGDGKVYQISQEKDRRIALGRGLKNLAIELKTRIITATQASAVSPEELNNPDFKMTRYNISRDKNTLDPFSYLFTMNQTSDEKEIDIMRIYCDKVRKYRSGQLIKIMQSYDKERFYDHVKTQELKRTSG